MGMPQAAHDWTVDRVLALPNDGNRHEVVDGELLVTFVFELPGGRRPERWSDITQILLAIEVLSPSTARADRQVKRRRYQRHGIPEYWIVDLDSRLVERWRPGDERPEILHDALTWQVSDSAARFELDLAAFFGEVLAE